MADAFDEVFWVLPNAPLPRPGEVFTDDEPLPDPVARKREELRSSLASLDLTQAEQIRDAIGACDQYVRSLRAARSVGDLEGMSTWSSAIIDQHSTIPVAFDEPIALVVEAMLIINLGSSLAHSRTADCIAEAAQCFCQAAGLVQYVVALEDTLCTSLQTDVPVELPDLSPRILGALVDIAVAMAQQLAIVKAVFFSESPYSKSVLQKLHGACYCAFDAFETAVARSCYSSQPKRAGCTTLLGFSSIFSRIHRSVALQLEAEMDHADGEIGEAIAFVRAARHQLQTRTSMREPGLPPLDGDGRWNKQHERLVPLVEKKRGALKELEMAWSKQNDSIYFAPIPPEDTLLSLELPQALIMNAIAYDANTRLGSVRMFHENVGVFDEADMVTNMDGLAIRDTADEDNEVNENASDGYGDSIEEILMHQSRRDTDDNVEKTDSGRSLGSSASDIEPATVPSMNQGQPQRDESVPSHKHAKSFDYRPVESSPSEEPGNRIVTQLTRNARSTRRMATRVEPQKSMTSRKLLGDIGKPDSLIVLQQNEELLRKVVTEESVFRMKRTMQGGVEVYRLVKDTWKKEILRVHGDQIVLTRKKAIAILSKQLKIPWATVHAFQHELQPTNQVLQLLAAPGKRMTSILIIAGRGEQVGPNELTFRTPEENAVAVASLQRFLQEKRVGGASTRVRD